MEIMSVGRDPAGSLWAFIREVACCSVLFQWRCLGWGGERETSPGVVACWSGRCHDRPPLSHLNRLVPGPDLINLPGAFCAPWNSSDLFPSRSMHPGGVCGGSSMRTTAPGVREPRGFLLSSRSAADRAHGPNRVGWHRAHRSTICLPAVKSGTHQPSPAVTAGSATGSVGVLLVWSRRLCSKVG